MTLVLMPGRIMRWWDHFADAAKDHLSDTGLDAYDLAAICERESRGGEALTPSGPAGLGDAGHGHGLMQIDDRWHQAFIASGRWKDPGENIHYAANLLHSLWHTFKARAPAIASYNCGPGKVRYALAYGHDVDFATAHGNYSKDVIAHADAWRGRP